MTPLEYYSDRSIKLRSDKYAIKNSLKKLSLLRFGIFLAGFFGVYLTWGNWLVVTGIVLFEIVIFLILVTKYTNLKLELVFVEKLIQLIENEIGTLTGSDNMFDDGKAYLDSDHFYNQDLDLFGPNSLFSYLNRTTSKQGANRLAHKLNENNVEDIDIKQNALRDLASKSEWREEFTTRALLANPEIPLNNLVKWIVNYKSFSQGYFNWLPKVFGLISAFLIFAFVFDFIPFTPVLVWLILGLGLVGIHVGKTNKLYLNSTKAQEVFRQYSKILKSIEKTQFQSDYLNDLQKHFQTKEISASNEMIEFAKLTDYLGNRNNILLTVILNGFFLWDLIYVYKIETWIAKNRQSFGEWSDLIHEFDALNSMANYVFNHPKMVFPVINDDAIISAKELGHPIISEDKNVKNDALIEKKNFFIITGANMAGKSTFLRTIGLSIVMANNGLPINAKEFKYSPVSLISSMRTSDSLADDESYFFSELKRLKFIVESIKRQDYFIILDEILKGTNSKDKAEGSYKFVQRLVDSGSTGLIATHDLSLCSIENNYPQVRNFYFDAEIIKNELHFDYKMKKGVCKNMNASFLLKKMDII